MKIRKRTHRYFEDNDAESSATADRKSSDTNVDNYAVDSGSSVLVQDKNNKRRRNHELLQKEFETNFGYVNDLGSRQRGERFTRNFKNNEYWDGGENVEPTSADDAMRDNNWPEEREGVSGDGSGNGESFDIPEFTQSFPNDLVSYLKNIASSLNNVDSGTAELMKKKCLEECKKNEVLLLRFESSCRVVEEVFNGYEPGASSFHAAVLALPETYILDAILTGCSCRTLETLLFALSTNNDQQVFARWTEVIVKHCDKIVDNPNSSHFLRSLFRALIGLPKKETELEQHGKLDAFTKLRQKLTKEFNANCAIKKCFCSLVDGVLDFQCMKKKINTETVSLVLQEAVKCEWLVKGEKRKDFIMQSVNESNEMLRQCRSKFGSHFWQILLKRADEEEKELLYNTVFSTNLNELALDQYATYIVGTFVDVATSEELVTSIFDELSESFMDLCSKGKWTIVLGLIKASVDHEEKQKGLVKKIRSCFSCSKKSDKNLLVPYVFTMKAAHLSTSEDGKIEFDVKFGDYNGSKLLQEMIRLKCNKTVIKSLKSLTFKTLLDLALNDKGTFVIQAFLKSDSVALDDKLYISNALKPSWDKLMNSRFGSYVFDVMWDTGFFNIGEKRAIMVKLCSEFNEGKSGMWRMMAKKLNLQNFKENRKGWLKSEEARMKKLCNGNLNTKFRS
uniref:PUM-HD domain-containing protein n=1 Tax=Syphacia muris TaxID=451379 RepID=A0A0N5AMI5_9BILA